MSTRDVWANLDQNISESNWESEQIQNEIQDEIDFESLVDDAYEILSQEELE